MKAERVASIVLACGLAAPATAAAVESGPEPAAAEPAPPEQTVSESAGEPTFTLFADTTIASTYVFRGIPQYANASVPSSQSTVGVGVEDLGPGTLTLSLWNATALTGFRKHGGTQLELDVTASYQVNGRSRVFLELINLTNEPLVAYQGIRERPIQMEYYGVWGRLGVRMAW